VDWVTSAIQTQMNTKPTWTVTASETTVTLNAARLQVYIAIVVGEDTPLPSLPANPTTGDMVVLVNNYGSNVTVVRNGKTINGAAADYTLAANAVDFAVYYPNNWVVA